MSDRDKALRASLVGAINRLAAVIENGELLAATCHVDLLDAATEEIQRLRAEAAGGPRVGDDAQVKVCGETKDHVVFPSDYPNESKLHIMRHGDGDYGVAISAGERWPIREYVTFCASGGRNIDAWQAASALWRALQPREVGGR